jgi:NADH-quinone oxidoreductase subunit H
MSRSQDIAFFIFTISIFAETNRMPFDRPECETELVGGYHTEYSSMKFALFFMGEYAAMVIGSALIITLFLGGWSVGFGLDQYISQIHIGSFYFGGLIHMGCFLTKLLAVILGGNMSSRMFLRIREAQHPFRGAARINLTFRKAD